MKANERPHNRLFDWFGGRKNFIAVIVGVLFGGFVLVGTFILQWFSKAGGGWYDFAKFFIGFDFSFLGAYMGFRVTQKHLELKSGIK